MTKDRRPAYRKPPAEDGSRLLSGVLEEDLVEVRRQLSNSDDLLSTATRRGRWRWRW